MSDDLTGNYRDVFLAVLSMDVYMRDWQNLQANLPNPVTQIGDATVGMNSADFGTVDGLENSMRLDQDAQFFGQSYTDDGTIIISYKGIAGISEIFNALGIANGSITPRVVLAAAFYQNVVDATPQGGGFFQQYFDADAIFTGHSMGGALAGIVSTIYDKVAVVFDNVGFENVLTTLAENPDQAYPLFYRIDGPNSTTATIPPPHEQVSGYAVYGEPATATRLFQSFSPVSMTSGLNVFNPLNEEELHDVALAAILTYGYALKSPDSDTWPVLIGNFSTALFNDNLAKALGNKGTDPSYFMRAEIAYSAISSGTMPYGDTGIVSFYDDADTLGQVQKDGGFTGLLSSQNTGSALSPAQGLAEIAVQFAADQAINQNTDADIEDAFERDGSTLKVDLDPTEWVTTFKQASSNATTPSILGLGDFFDGVLSNISVRMSLADPTYAWITSTLSGFSPALLKQLDEITEVDITLNGGDLSGAGTQPAAHGGTPGGAMLVGGDGQGTLTGSDKGNDILIGGSTVTTGSGNDLILTGGGTETLTMGQGKNEILADSDNGFDLDLTYAGATGASDTGPGGSGGSGGGPTGDASPGSDLIIGTAAGGATYTFTDADKAAFTVVWDGAGKNTFNIDTSSSSDSQGGSPPPSMSSSWI